MKPNALIAGSTGLVGKELLTLLSLAGYYDELHLPVRTKTNPEKAGVYHHLVDFSNLDAFNPGKPICDIYICLGTTQKKSGGKAGFYKVDHDYVLNVARWAKQNGVEKVCLISSIGANPSSNSFYLKTKGKIEQELVNLGFRHLCILRPSLLLGKRNESRWAEDIAAKIYPALSFILVGKLKKYRAVEAKKVAEAMFYFTTKMTEKLLIIESDGINALNQ
jgi:uncharacterized protein YbjT (DUF2867 family)